jgi:hypothetical protein
MPGDENRLPRHGLTAQCPVPAFPPSPGPPSAAAPPRSHVKLRLDLTAVGVAEAGRQSAMQDVRPCR